MTSRPSISRRSFLQSTAAATAATCLPKLAFALNAPAPGTAPTR